jgi:hypothetical protein
MSIRATYFASDLRARNKQWNLDRTVARHSDGHPEFNLGVVVCVIVVAHLHVLVTGLGQF